MTDITAPTGAHNSGELEFHPLANRFPLMRGAEFDALVEDIRINGLREPIALYQGKILDGRNRYRACIAADITPDFIDLGDLNEGQLIHPRGGAADYWIGNPTAYVISANIPRRHLTAEQKRDLVAKLVKAQPDKSDRQIAKQAKVDHKTVAAVRREGEARGEIPHVET